MFGFGGYGGCDIRSIKWKDTNGGIQLTVTSDQWWLLNDSSSFLIHPQFLILPFPLNRNSPIWHFTSLPSRVYGSPAYLFLPSCSFIIVEVCC